MYILKMPNIKAPILPPSNRYAASGIGVITQLLEIRVMRMEINCKRGMIKMRKIRLFAVLIFLLLFSTCNAFAEEVRLSSVNKV